MTCIICEKCESSNFEGLEPYINENNILIQVFKCKDCGYIKELEARSSAIVVTIPEEGIKRIVTDKQLIEYAIKAREKAITFRSKVGAALLTERGQIFTGFNIETYIHKGYHAEEVALIRALFNGYSKTKIKKLALCYKFTKHGADQSFYPGCGSCRQYLWEFTNPDLEIIAADPEGNILGKTNLKEEYPNPYPKFIKEERKI